MVVLCTKNPYDSTVIWWRDYGLVVKHLLGMEKVDSISNKKGEGESGIADIDTADLDALMV